MNQVKVLYEHIKADMKKSRMGLRRVLRALDEAKEGDCCPFGPITGHMTAAMKKRASGFSHLDNYSEASHEWEKASLAKKKRIIAEVVELLQSE